VPEFNEESNDRFLSKFRWLLIELSQFYGENLTKIDDNRQNLDCFNHEFVLPGSKHRLSAVEIYSRYGFIG
jgi:hypothetical protein